MPQTARNAYALVGCDKNRHSLCCAPWYRRITTTGVARLAIIHFLSATQFMMDLIRGSLTLYRMGESLRVSNMLHDNLRPRVKSGVNSNMNIWKYKKYIEAYCNNWNCIPP